MESTHQEKYIKLKRFAAMILLLVALLTLAGCSGSYYDASSGKCGWCGGLGYAAKGDGTPRTVTCSHCHGTGLN